MRISYLHGQEKKQYESGLVSRERRTDLRVSGWSARTIIGETPFWKHPSRVPRTELQLKLPELSLRLSYRTGRDDLVRGFFIPCLESSVLYRRAAGYFTSSGLALAARGVASLAARRGKMQLVVSPYLEPSDVEALRTASDAPLDALRSMAARSSEFHAVNVTKDRGAASNSITPQVAGS